MIQCTNPNCENEGTNKDLLGDFWCEEHDLRMDAADIAYFRYLRGDTDARGKPLLSLNELRR